MTRSVDLIHELEKLKTIAPAGFALAFHIEYTRPTFLIQTYPEDWIREYSEKGMVMSDPTVHWGFENDGTIPWTNLTEQDTAGVLKRAAAFGLNFGITCALEADGTRSIGSFARSDRQLTDAERADTLAISAAIHQATAGLKVLDADVLAKMEDMSISISQPGGT